MTATPGTNGSDVGRPDFPVISVLPGLGFSPAGRETIADWELHDTGLQLFVTEGLNRHFQTSLNFSGSYLTDRTAQSIEFSIGQFAADREQALALVGYYLRGIPTVGKMAWLVDAWQLEGRLPWNEQRSRYLAYPRCAIDRDWFRLPNKTLRELAASAGEDAIASFFFDGTNLRITAGDVLLAMPATGADPFGPVSVRLVDLASLPSRLMEPTISLIMGDGAIIIGRWRFPVHEVSA